MNQVKVTRRQALVGTAAAAVTASVAIGPAQAQSDAPRIANPTLTGLAPSPSPDLQETSMPYVKTRDGTEIYVKDWGDASAPPVILIHWLPAQRGQL